MALRSNFAAQRAGLYAGDVQRKPFLVWPHDTHVYASTEGLTLGAQGGQNAS
jgi:hypothetical protein